MNMGMYMLGSRKEGNPQNIQDDSNNCISGKTLPDSFWYTQYFFLESSTRWGPCECAEFFTAIQSNFRYIMNELTSTPVYVHQTCKRWVVSSIEMLHSGNMCNAHMLSMHMTLWRQDCLSFWGLAHTYDSGLGIYILLPDVPYPPHLLQFCSHLQPWNFS